MFGSVMVPCPKCGEKSEFQSKGGECLLQIYELEDCPADVLGDVNRHAPNTCLKCGTVFEVGSLPKIESLPKKQRLDAVCGIKK